ncbi:MAG TPA: phosphoribosyltransferase family protein [Methylomusa anaerophila]|uniref:Putative phosphoribosyl transferase/MT0597 n=1 Tax=Methylomusa anaerophila TaxID=1930071 RepID=A0A348AHS8_9FIRM|nr:phosphoribosyltransferase family protein [Methylomusa anaerophila]BBB90626.1 putative phosphoribosyl transferase/MT0597 [Methylomusa anaerophila]HML88767.1 phosphoribosyltransferase family protein [Methylomusa anaerophila]
MFNNRTHAGELLAERLAELHLNNPYILAVPRGGLAVAAPIAAKLQAKVGVLIAKKIGHPLNPEVAIGAMMPDGSLIHDNQYVSGIGVKQEAFDEILNKVRRDLNERLQAYSHIVVKNHEVKGRHIIIVDDGIATGYTMQAAVKWLKKWGPSSITVAVPVAANDVLAKLKKEVDNLAVLDQRDVFEAVGAYYKDFGQMTDKEALEYHRYSENAVVRP